MSKLRIPINEHDHQSGNPKAKVTLVEYGDYECSHCGVAYPLIKKLMKQYGNELLFVFRNFPLQEVHPHAMTAALAAEAAAKQGKFWEMHDMIYENQDDLSDSNLVSYAEALGLNVEEFEQDRKSRETLAKVESDFESGIRSGVNGTPSFFLNGNRLNDYDESYGSLAAAVQSVI